MTAYITTETSDGANGNVLYGLNQSSIRPWHWQTKPSDVTEVPRNAVKVLPRPAASNSGPRHLGAFLD
jgi:hypothetical protein